MPNQEPSFAEDAFTPMEYGIASGQFEIAVTNHGDGDSFSWKSKAGETDSWYGYSYRVTRVGRGYVVSDGAPVSSWRLELTNREAETKIFLVDCPQHQIHEEQHGEQIPPTNLDDVWNAVLDLTHETKRLNRPLQNLIRPIGHTGRIAMIPIRHKPGPSDEAI